MATGINAAVVAGYALEQSRHIARAQIDVRREPVCINEKYLDKNFSGRIIEEQL